MKMAAKVSITLVLMYFTVFTDMTKAFDDVPQHVFTKTHKKGIRRTFWAGIVQY